MTRLNLDREMLASGGCNVQLKPPTLHQLHLGAAAEPTAKAQYSYFVAVCTQQFICGTIMQERGD